MHKADYNYKQEVVVGINQKITFKQHFEEGIGFSHELSYSWEENLWQKKKCFAQVLWKEYAHQVKERAKRPVWLQWYIKGGKQKKVT